MHNIPCEIIQDILPYYVDDLVSDVSRSAVDDHIAVCPECRQKLESITLERSLQYERRLAADNKELAHLKQQKKNHTCTLIISLGVSAVIISLFWIFMHWMSYPIRPDCKNADRYIGLTTISDEYGFGYASVPVTVYEAIKVNDKYCYLLFEKNSRLYYGRLESDFTGWYQKPYGSYIGDSVNPYFTVKLIGTGQDKYMLFAGRNPDLTMSRAIIETEGFSYAIDIPNQAVFMMIIPVDQSLGYLSRYGDNSDAAETEAADGLEAFDDNSFREWKLADTPKVQIFDVSGTDITSSYIKDDESKYDIAPDLSNLKSCVLKYYELIPGYYGKNENKRSIRYVMPFKNYYYVLAQVGDIIDILRLSRSTTGRYCIDHISQGLPGMYKAEVDWLDYKGKNYIIFGCMDCPAYANRVRISIYDRLDKNHSTYLLELPENRSDDCCIAISEVGNDFIETARPNDVAFLP